MKNEYGVIVPVAGAVCITVEAESAEEAKKIAMDTGWSMDIELIDKNESIVAIDMHEIDQYERITQGNVLYAPFNEIEVEEY